MALGDEGFCAGRARANIMASKWRLLAPAATNTWHTASLMPPYPLVTKATLPFSLNNFVDGYHLSYVLTSCLARFEVDR